MRGNQCHPNHRQFRSLQLGRRQLRRLQLHLRRLQLLEFFGRHLRHPPCQPRQLRRLRLPLPNARLVRRSPHLGVSDETWANLVHAAGYVVPAAAGADTDVENRGTKRPREPRRYVACTWLLFHSFAHLLVIDFHYCFPHVCGV